MPCCQQSLDEVGVLNGNRLATVGQKDGAIVAVGSDMQDGRMAPVNALGQLDEFDHRVLGHDEAWLRSVSDDGQFSGKVVAAGAGVAGARQDALGVPRLVRGSCGRPDVGQVLRPEQARLLMGVLIPPAYGCADPTSPEGP